jgi:hypothetical protein
MMILLTICPFDHLPSELIKKGTKGYILRLFFPETEYLEKAYRELEGKMEELQDQLTMAIHHQGGKVTKAHVGVLSEESKEIIK